MEFYYFTDPIILDEQMENNQDECFGFDEYCESLRKLLIENGYAQGEITVFYKRNLDRQCVIGYQVISGDKYDLTNYLIYDAKAHRFGNNVLSYCDIDMHADAKAVEEAMSLNDIIYGSVSEFLNTRENMISHFINDDQSYNIMRTISLEKRRKENTSLFRRLFGSKPQ